MRDLEGARALIAVCTRIDAQCPYEILNQACLTKRYVAKAVKANCAEVAVPALKFRQTLFGYVGCTSATLA